MDIVFNCPHCDLEMETDASGAGMEIKCPNCGETITVPQPTPETVVTPILNPIATSAAAKEEKQYKVPIREKPTEVLIKKPNRPLEFAAKETDKQIRVKTIRHHECFEVGKDQFDEVVTDFLRQVGQENIIAIQTINYTHLDIGSQKLLTDFGVLIVFKG